MKSKLQLAAAISALALLSACGESGGGVASTPAPPGGGSGGTPTPTPTPTSNDDLVAPLVSQTFTNDAVNVTAQLANPTNTPPATVGATSLTVRYDAGTSSYTVTDGARTQTFAASDFDASASTAEANVYTRKDGTTTDGLLISKASADVGTAFAPQYRYVGGGAWSHLTGDGKLTTDSFTYGVVTPDAAVPRTGSATYDVQLRGLVATPMTSLQVTGSGRFDVDFAGGNLSGQGLLINQLGNGVGSDLRTWQIDGKLASNQNGFNAKFGLSPTLGASVIMSGGANGRFYGPAAQELGAAWWWQDAAQTTSYSGYILGKNDSLYPKNTTIDALHYAQTLASGGWAETLTGDPSTGNFGNIGGLDPGMPLNLIQVNYSEADQALAISYPLIMNYRLLTPSIRDAASSNATFDVYRYIQTDAVPSGVTRVGSVFMFKPGASNPELALSYTSFGYWSTHDLSGIPASTNASRGFFYYGLGTPAGGVPTSGTASYDGRLYAMYKTQPSTALALSGDAGVDVTGTAHFDVNFGTMALGGNVHPIGVYNGGTFDFGQMLFSGTLSAADRTLMATWSNGKGGGIQGQFMGPTAQEIGARFNVTGLTTPDSKAADIYGVILAKH